MGLSAGIVALRPVVEDGALQFVDGIALLVDEPCQAVVQFLAVQQVRIHETGFHFRDGGEVEVLLGFSGEQDVDVRFLIDVMGIRGFEAVVLDDEVASLIVAPVFCGDDPRVLDDVVDGEVDDVRPTGVDPVPKDLEKTLGACFLRLVSALQKPLVRVAIIRIQADHAVFRTEAILRSLVDGGFVFLGKGRRAACEGAFPNVDFSVGHTFIR